jgi:hypothetical protein
MMNLDQVRVVDPILTQLAQGYKNSDGVATFFAPAVSMNVRAGRTLVFGKEAFAAQSFLRSPGTNILKIQNEFGTRSFALRQEAISWQIAEEVAAEAKNGAAAIDLRAYAAKDAANRLQQSWEIPRQMAGFFFILVGSNFCILLPFYFSIDIIHKILGRICCTYLLWLH